MSIYSEAEHAIALSDTVYWIDHPPMTPEERCRFGRYHYRLKDFNEAFHWLRLAASEQVESAWFELGECLRNEWIDVPLPETIPDAEYCYRRAWSYYNRQLLELSASGVSTKDDPAEDSAALSECLYRCGFMLRYGFGTTADPQKARHLFSEVLELHKDLTPENFDICCDYSNAGMTDGGTRISAPVDVCKLPVGDACLELAKYALDSEDFPLARKLLRKAYDFHSEEALYLDYKLFCDNFDTYEYQDEIRELFQFPDRAVCPCM